MHLVFVDDSGQPSPKRQRLNELVAFGAVAIPAGSVRACMAEIDRIKSQFDIPEDEELKWNVPKGSRQWNLRDQRSVLQERLIQVALDCGATSAVSIVERNEFFVNRDGPKKSLEDARDYLYERIQWFLDGDSVKSDAVVIADRPPGGRGDETQWMKEAHQLLESGTRYVEFNRILLPVITAPSQVVQMLQLADLVTAATVAAVAGSPHGLRLTKLLGDLAYKSPAGQVGGYGVKIVPDDLVDLYREFGDTQTPLKFGAKPFPSWGDKSPRYSVPDRRYYNDRGLEQE